MKKKSVKKMQSGGGSFQDWMKSGKPRNNDIFRSAKPYTDAEKPEIRTLPNRTKMTPAQRDSFMNKIAPGRMPIDTTKTSPKAKPPTMKKGGKVTASKAKAKTTSKKRKK